MRLRFHDARALALPDAGNRKLRHVVRAPEVYLIPRTGDTGIGRVVIGSTVEDAGFCRKLLARYKDLDLGLADAAVIATAERLGIRTILTVDERDFRAVRTVKGEAFRLLPADA